MSEQLDFDEQRLMLEADLDWDLRHAHLPNISQEARALHQLIRLVRGSLQGKPTEP